MKLIFPFGFGLALVVGCSQSLESKTIHFTADTEVTEDTTTQRGDISATGTTIDTDLYETGQVTNSEDARTRYPSGWVHSPITESSFRLWRERKGC